MAARVLIAVELDDQGAVTGLRQLESNAGKVGGSFVRAGRESNVVLTKMRKDTEQARDAADLFSHTMGVALPRELKKVIAESERTRNALASAFNVAVVATFASVIINTVLAAAQAIVTEWNRAADQMAMAMEESAKRQNAAILESQERQRDRALEMLLGGLNERDQIIAKSFAEQAKLEEERRLAIAHGNTKAAEQLGKEILQLETKLQQDLFDLEQKGIRERTEEAKAKWKEVADQRLERELKFWEQVSQDQQKALQELAKQEEKLARAREDAAMRTRSIQDENIQIAIGMLEGEARVNAELEAKIAFLEEIKRNYKDQAEVVQAATDQEILLQKRAAQQIAEIRKDQAEKMARDWEAAVDRMASELERFLDDPIRFIQQQWKRMVLRMVAEWLLGLQTIRNASAGAGAGGGVFGGGGIFGLPGIGPTPPFFPGAAGGGGGGNPFFSGFAGGAGFAAGSGLFAAPLSAGGGFLPGGAQPSGTQQRGLLELLFSRGFQSERLPGLGPGLGLLGLGIGLGGARRGGALGTLASVGGFALAGFQIGGPLGAVIGGIVGLFAGLFGGGRRRRRQRERYEREQFAPAVKAIEDAYNFHQLDYLSARTQLDQLRQQGLQQVRALGGRGTVINQLTDAAIARINATEQERQRRLGLTVSPPIFEKGGFVGQGPGARAQGPGFGPLRLPTSLPQAPSWMQYQDGGAVPAILHRGEFVVNERATRRNRPMLERINSGAGSGAGEMHLHLHIETPDPPSFIAWLRNGGMEKVLTEAKRYYREGGS